MLENSYLLDVDIKHGTSTNTPMFRRGDTAVLRFRVHDDSSNANTKTFDSALITIKMPSGITLTEKCLKETVQNVDIARFEFKKIHTIEVGIYSIYLTLVKGEDRVSVPPIPVEFEDNVSDGNYPFIDVINELEQQLVDLQNKVNAGIPLEEINNPDGVAGLDSMKKLPKVLLNDYFEKHIATTMYKDGAHGFKIDDDDKPWVLVNGNWVEAQISEFPMGGGNPDPIPPTISVDNGKVTISFPEPVDISVRKWDKGIHDVFWFKDNGTIISSNNFQVTEIGNYTFYYKLTDGREYIVIFQVKEDDLILDTKTPIENIPNGSIVLFGDTEWIVLDNKKRMLITKTYVTDRQFDISTGVEKFDPNNNANIGYWLNNEFMNRFSPIENNKIIVSTWNTGSELNERETTTTSQVGLISASELEMYKDALVKNYSTDGVTVFSNGFATLTENSAKNSEIWIGVIENNNMTISTASKNIPTKIRPVIYLQENTKLDIYEEQENTLLSQLVNGDVVNFSNMKWVVLDKEQGYLMYYDDAIYRKGIDKENSTNVLDWLDSKFYYSLTSQARRYIQSNSWYINKLNETITDSTTVIGMVGLLSQKLISDFKNIIEEKMLSTNIILTTNRTEIVTQWQAYNPKIYDTGGDYVRWDISTAESLIIPIVKLTKDATVGAIKQNNKALKDVSPYEEIHFGGYTWFKGLDNTLVLKSKFSYDSETKIIPFAYATDDTIFSIRSLEKQNNIGNVANTVFAQSMIYVKDRPLLQDMSLKIGHIGDESSTVGSFKAGLIPTSIWQDNYSLLAYEKLGVTEDFWLLNKFDDINAAYVNAKTGMVESANAINSEKLMKPIIKLSEDEIVTVYEKETGIYADIPDDELRKILNSQLGNGSVIDKILLEDTKKITYIDTLEFGMVSNLKGMELLTNCTGIRAAPSMTTDPNFVVKFTDMTPLIQLGGAKILTELDFYGFDNNESITVMNQLKGQFPYLTSGGVYTSGHKDIVISLAELKGITEGVLVTKYERKERYSINERATYTDYTITFEATGKIPLDNYEVVIDYMADGTSITPTVTENISGYYSAVVRYSYKQDSTKEKNNYKITISAKNSDGDSDSYVNRLDPSFISEWTGKENNPSIIGVRAMATATDRITITFPENIDGLVPRSIDYSLYNQWKASTIVIPKNYTLIKRLLAGNLGVSNLYVYNNDIKWVRYDSTFGSIGKGTATGGGVWDTTNCVIHAGQNSTTYQEYLNRNNYRGGSYYSFKTI